MDPKKVITNNNKENNKIPDILIKGLKSQNALQKAIDTVISNVNGSERSKTTKGKKKMQLLEYYEKCKKKHLNCSIGLWIKLINNKEHFKNSKSLKELYKNNELLMDVINKILNEILNILNNNTKCLFLEINLDFITLLEKTTLNMTDYINLSKQLFNMFSRCEKELHFTGDCFFKKNNKK